MNERKRKMEQIERNRKKVKRKTKFKSREQVSGQIKEGYALMPKSGKVNSQFK